MRGLRPRSRRGRWARPQAPFHLPEKRPNNWRSGALRCYRSPLRCPGRHQGCRSARWRPRGCRRLQTPRLRRCPPRHRNPHLPNRPAAQPSRPAPLRPRTELLSCPGRLLGAPPPMVLSLAPGLPAALLRTATPPGLPLERLRTPLPVPELGGLAPRPPASRGLPTAPPSPAPPPSSLRGRPLQLCPRTWRPASRPLKPREEPQALALGTTDCSRPSPPSSSRRRQPGRRRSAKLTIGPCRAPCRRLSPRRSRSRSSSTRRRRRPPRPYRCKTLQSGRQHA
mmetsp:Transcript_92106/g.260233  ORF Transcript_92106/g.260233 Transcript_92106/m.260233 type:complete len:281 (+) Transcript_92106:234-1076(+)